MSASSSESKSSDEVMPMIPVPEALYIMLQRTADILIQDKNQESFEEVVDVGEVMAKGDYPSLMGRILAKDIQAPEPGYPPFPASIMDGYAIRFEDWKDPTLNKNDDNEDWTHVVTSTVYAGESQSKMSTISDTLPEAAYVTTGAVMHPPFDTVVPIEKVQVSSSTPTKIRITSAPTEKGHWIRPIGCDIPPQTTVLTAGTSLTPAELGTLLQLGVSTVVLRRKLKVGILSTGNELLSDNTPSSSTSTQGHIPDINRPMLLSLLAASFSNTIVPIDLGIASDDLTSLKQKLSFALEEEKCDVLVTSGGVSMGEKDLLAQVFKETYKAELHFGRLNMKPGKPTKFMTLKTTSMKHMILALPGNPVSALVCSHLLLCPMLHLLLQGPSVNQEDPPRPAKKHKDHHHHHHDHNDKDNKDTIIDKIVRNAIVHNELYATLSHDIKLDAERPEYHRVRLMQKYQKGKSENPTLLATSTGVQRSSRILSMCHADGLLCLPRGTESQKIAKKGKQFLVLLISNVGSLRTNGLWGSIIGNANPLGEIPKDAMCGTRAKNSQHMSSLFKSKLKRPWKVGIVTVLDTVSSQVLPNSQFSLDEDERFIWESKNGLAKRSISLGSNSTVEEAQEQLHSILHQNYVQYCNHSKNEDPKDKSHVDILLVVTMTSSSSSSSTTALSQKGFLRRSTAISASLRNLLQNKPNSKCSHKQADTIAMKARQGATLQNPLAALMNVVIGYFDYNHFIEENQEVVSGTNAGGALVISLSDVGIEGAFHSIKHLLGHAISLGRAAGK